MSPVMQCLDDNVATEFVAGSLSTPAAARVEGHLASCRDCRALVAALAGTDLDDSDLQTAPRRPPGDLRERPAARLKVGDRVGRYLVLSTLGSGGMGVVFAAYDPQLDRKVALKLLRPGLGVSAEEARNRLKREAQAVAQLSHPNVVAVYDVGAIDNDTGDIYLAMEFVEGDTLTNWLTRWPRTWREIVDVFVQAGRGLLAAHSVGLLHRDFKPDNVLVGSDGRVRVGDFGLARSLFEPLIVEQDSMAIARAVDLTTRRPLDVALTRTGTVLGTPRYMPPEQLTGPDIDARSDQFSFCVALYEALYGCHPLPGSTSDDMLVRDARPAAPPDNTKVPAAITRVVMRGLERERAKRFGSMQDVLAGLVVAPPRSPMRVVGMAVAALALVGSTGALVVAHNEAPSLQPPTDAVQILIAKLNAKEVELRIVLDKLKAAEAVHSSDTVAIADLTTKLAVERDQIDDVIAELEQVRATRAHAPHALLGTELDEVQDAQQSIVGCFDEWSDRFPDRDATLTVALELTPAGKAHDARAIGAISSVVLRDCISDALTRVAYKPSVDRRDLEVTVSWVDKAVRLVARVTGHHDGRVVDVN